MMVPSKSVKKMYLGEDAIAGSVEVEPILNVGVWELEILMLIMNWRMGYDKREGGGFNSR